MIDKINQQGSATFTQQASSKVTSSQSQEPKDRVDIGGKQPEKEWTVLYYIDGKNNLASMALHSLSSLTKVGSDENVNLVAQVAVPEKDVERGLVEKPATKTKEFFPGSEVIGKVDMGDPETLYKFLKWGMERYPAKHYAVVLWDHGAGFKGSMTDDETKHLIDNKELADVLERIKKNINKKVDVINFNACLMGQAEVAYELKDKAKYMVASEEVEAGLRIPIPGLFGTVPQHKVVEDLQKGIKEKGEITPEELAKLYVFEAKSQFGAQMFTPTQSAIDLSKMDKVKDAADKLSKALLDKIKEDPSFVDVVRKDISKTQRFLNYDLFAEPYIDYRDVGDFAKTILKDPKIVDENIKNAASELLSSVKEAVIAEENTVETTTGRSVAGATGLSAYLSKDYGHDLAGTNPIDNVPAGGTHGYEQTSFAKDTHWDELLKAVSKDTDWMGKHPKIRKFLETVMPLSTYEGYEQAYHAIKGATSPAGGIIPITKFPYMIPLPGPAAAIMGAAGGVLRGTRGMQRITEAATKDIKPSSKHKLTIGGAIDVAVGAGSVVTCAALLAGCGAVAFPAAAVVLGLGVGRTIVSLISGVLKTRKASKMSISEKIASMKKEEV